MRRQVLVERRTEASWTARMRIGSSLWRSQLVEERNTSVLITVMWTAGTYSAGMGVRTTRKKRSTSSVLVEL